jgi:hypothetical protein
MRSRLFTRVSLGHVSRTRISSGEQADSKCHCCGVRVQDGEQACCEHSSGVLTPAMMKALFDQAMQGPS